MRHIFKLQCSQKYHINYSRVSRRRGHVNKLALVAAAIVAIFGCAAPAFSQMVGVVGGNAGQSPSEAREVDQKFDELKNEGRLDASKSNLDKELEAGAALVKQSKFAEALPHLEFVVDKRPNDVTALIYLGFSHRMIGSTLIGASKTAEYVTALSLYRRAQAIEPDNKLLHEYAGKVLMLLHDVPNAKVELNALKNLCPSGCPERAALEAVVPPA